MEFVNSFPRASYDENTQLWMMFVLFSAMTCLLPGLDAEINTKRPLDEYLMHAALIRCFLVANTLPCHPLRRQSEAIVLIIMCAKPEEEALIAFCNCISIAQPVLTAQVCAFRVVLRDPLFSLA